MVDASYRLFGRLGGAVGYVYDATGTSDEGGSEFTVNSIGAGLAVDF